MPIVQCENGHYYDNKRDGQCPYCAKLHVTPFSGNALGEQLTSYIAADEENDNAQLTEAYGDFVSEAQKTISIFQYEEQNQLTVGWLVCISGVVKGKSYPIHAGRNFAGRSQEMDMVLSDDDELALEKHFSVVYDPKTIRFYLVAGSGQSYLNQQPISDECELKDGDEISAGQSRYIFVPFCKEGRIWK